MTTALNYCQQQSITETATVLMDSHVMMDNCLVRPTHSQRGCKIMVEKAGSWIYRGQSCCSKRVSYSSEAVLLNRFQDNILRFCIISFFIESHSSIQPISVKSPKIEQTDTLILKKHLLKIHSMNPRKLASK